MAGLEPILPTREIVGLEGKKNSFRNGMVSGSKWEHVEVGPVDFSE